MVGWSRRNRESSERRARYNEWFNLQTHEKQAGIRKKREEYWQKNKWKIRGMLVLGFVVLVVGLVLMSVFMPRPPIEHKMINGRDCVIYPSGCTSTGACWEERVVCE